MYSPNLRVDHVSIAVRELDRTLDFFLEHFPARMGRPKSDGYDGQFRWADFTIGSFRIELIESMRPGSFVERFLARRGEGFHHLSLNVEKLDPLDEALMRGGVRVVDRFDEGGGHQTLFIHPKSAFGTLIQFWQEPGMADAVEPGWGGIVEKGGLRWQVDHLSLALDDMAAAVAFFRRYFGGRVEVEPHLGYDQTFRVMQMRLRDYRLELMESARPRSFVERFLVRRGPGMHHISVDVEDLDAALAPFERSGVRIVDRFELAPGWKTAFLHPRSVFGTLIQFWQMPLDQWSRPGAG
ncbi:MAG: VOC family protein [Candidatus Binatia bacterium]